MPVRSANAEWSGDLKSGKGQMSLGGGAWQGPFSFASRFEDGQGTNPEELIAAAHAGCFSMAFSNILAGAGFTPKSVRTTARAHLEKTEGGFEITRLELKTEADVPGIEESEFQNKAEDAKKNCPVSKLYKGAQIDLQAKLVS